MADKIIEMNTKQNGIGPKRFRDVTFHTCELGAGYETNSKADIRNTYQCNCL